MLIEDTVQEPKNGPSAESAIGDGMIIDYISREAVKETPKERVRQHIARALFHEYGVDVDDMEPDFRMKVDGRNKKVDVAVFEHKQPHEPEHLRRVVVCKPEPKVGKRGTFKLRDHEQATKDLDELRDIMAAAEGCTYGLWTNGLDLFFLKKRQTRFDTRFEPIGDWPLADETIGTRDVVSAARARRADAEMLRVAFRRCHNFIHGNEGMPKDAAFWQFLYLIFAKLHDEEDTRSRDQRRFYAHPTEQFDEEGREAIRKRVIPLFDEVKSEYTSIFRGSEEISLSDRALAFMVSELAKYDFARTDVDAKGAAYQEIVGTNLRGDRGQYFTPRGAIKLAIDMLDPKPGERFLDPACGTGGFLVQAIAHLADGFRQEKGLKSGLESTDDVLSIQGRLGEYARANLFGADFDPFLVRAAQMNVVMASGATTNLFHLNSLEYPAGHMSGLAEARQKADLGTVDVLATNPPFGSDIPVSDPTILSRYELAHVWERADGGFRNTGNVQGSVAPEVLFIERCLAWLKPGGRMAIVLPDGILGNPGDEYIRWWVLRRAWVLASVDLPVEVFIVEANVNILTSILVLKKKTEAELRAEAVSGAKAYPVFMAVAEKVGFDRRGNTLYKRSPDGEELLEEVTEEERIRIGGEVVRRTLQRRQKIVDDDLPVIAAKYGEFRERYEEPGT